MNQPPLNPDALESAAIAFYLSVRGTSRRAEDWETVRGVYKQGYRNDAEAAVSAYLAVAQPEVNSVEELDKLPIGSLIMMSGVVAPFLHTDDGWESTRTPGKPVWDYTPNPSYLPARVLYRPTKEYTNGSK